MNTIPDDFLDSRDFARIARAIAYIDARYREQPRLAAVARHAGLSEFHFNRLFRRWAGLTPKQYLAAVTARAARDALATERSVLDAALAVGLSGPGRLHDLTVTLEALTPGEIKASGAGARIAFGFSTSPFGDVLVAETARGLCHLGFVDTGGEARTESALRARWPQAQFERDDARALARALQIWSARGARGPLCLAVAGTNFQVQVWRALLELDAATTTYGELAARLALPLCARAVGHAVGSNPVGWLIPCHRVLRSSGGLGGYRWGEDRKRAMLAWEALRSPSAAPRMALAQARMR